MNELGFRYWLSKKDVSNKVQSDLISRLKRLERSLENCDIDQQYNKDKCRYMFSLFCNKGINENMNKYQNVDLPIGKYYLSSFKYALSKYVDFMDEMLISSSE